MFLKTFSTSVSGLHLNSKKELLESPSNQFCTESANPIFVSRSISDRSASSEETMTDSTSGVIRLRYCRTGVNSELVGTLDASQK